MWSTLSNASLQTRWSSKVLKPRLASFNKSYVLLNDKILVMFFINLDAFHDNWSEWGITIILAVSGFTPPFDTSTSWRCYLNCIYLRTLKYNWRVTIKTWYKIERYLFQFIFVFTLLVCFCYGDVCQFNIRCRLNIICWMRVDYLFIY